MNKLTKWVIDPQHSEIEFKVKHLMITNVKGTFKEYRAQIFTEGNDFMNAEIEVWIDPSSIDTGSPDRDKHLIGPDFFDVENHKQITFRANAYEKKKDKEHYKVTGDLTIKGITNKVTLDVEYDGEVKDPWGKEKAGFTVKGTIDRKNWGLNWNATLETGGLLLSDKVNIECNVQLSKTETMEVEENAGRDRRDSLF
jgi:polyisoprenoid-binding protein YceI